MIQLNNVSYCYNENDYALDSVSLEIKKGEFIGIAGRNGSGKSTLIRLINGLLLPLQGNVNVMGMDTMDNDSIIGIRKIAGMVFQDPQSQFIGMTVGEDVAFGPENLGLSHEDICGRVDTSLKAVGMYIYKDHTPRALSGGQKQKVALASILAMEPELILFDEATSMLDPVASEEVLKLIKQLHNKGVTIVYVTHRLEELIFADRLIIMDKGRIMHDDNPRKLLNEENILDSGIYLPPIIELSRRLCSEQVIEPIRLPISREELMEALCQLM